MSSHLSAKASPQTTIRRTPVKTSEVDGQVSPEMLRRAVENPGGAALGTAAILQLQRTHGNQFVSRMIQAGRSTPDIQACADCGDEQMIHTMRDDAAPESTQHGPGCGCGSCGRI